MACQCADHPRMHGEHRIPMTGRVLRRGPSPHARGTRETDLNAKIAMRTIPACTGNTGRAAESHPGAADHPRMHGEHGGKRTKTRGVRGPSPHARGTPRARSGQGAVRRTIPACTGNTSAPPCSARKTPDHPRMHGEHPFVRRTCQRSPGPSPHARGTRSPRPPSPARTRTIPACTGNTPPNA